MAVLCPSYVDIEQSPSKHTVWTVWVHLNARYSDKPSTKTVIEPSEFHPKHPQIVNLEYPSISVNARITPFYWRPI